MVPTDSLRICHVQIATPKTREDELPSIDQADVNMGYLAACEPGEDGGRLLVIFDDGWVDILDRHSREGCSAITIGKDPKDDSDLDEAIKDTAFHEARSYWIIQREHLKKAQPRPTSPLTSPGDAVS